MAFGPSWASESVGDMLCRRLPACINRRHLTASQKAVVALDILPMLEAEAKERQIAAGARGVEGGRGHTKEETLNQQVDEGFKKQPQAIEQAAKIVGVNKQYVQHMKTIAREAPESCTRTTHSNHPPNTYPQPLHIRGVPTPNCGSRR